jgi:hypothetical protein
LVLSENIVNTCDVLALGEKLGDEKVASDLTVLNLYYLIKT